MNINDNASSDEITHEIVSRLLLTTCDPLCTVMIIKWYLLL